LFSTILNAILLAMLVTITTWAYYNISLLIVGFLTARRMRRGAAKATNGSLRDVPKMSIIVPAKNEQRVIRRVLDSLLKVKYPDDRIEIIVVEDGSKDRTPEICKEYAARYPSKIRFFSRSLSAGKPSALNFALKQVTGEIVVVLDADNVPEPDFLVNAAKYFENPSIIAIQGVMDGINSNENFLTKLLLYEHKLWFEVFLPGKERTGLFIPLAGNCQFIRRELLQAVGGWDKSSLTEDIELTLRVFKAGDICLAPDVRSWQEMPRNLSSLVKQRLRWYRGYIETLIKHIKTLISDLPNRKGIDALITLSGPLVLSFYFISYLAGLFSLFIPILTSKSALVILRLLSYSMIIMLFLAGISISLYEKSARKVLWLPLIYLYWVLQNLLAFLALGQIILRRPRVWVKTPKTGSITLAENICSELGLEEYTKKKVAS